MESFQWNSNFLTDLKIVDEQHYKLTEIINRIAEAFYTGQQDKVAIDQLINEFIEYIVFHFQSEEKLMAQFKVDSRHLNKHVKIHKKFIHDIKAVYSNLDIENHKQSAIYFRYLILCVQHHILGFDTHMAKQIINIQSGMTPEQAFHHNGGGNFNISESLIEVMYDLFIHVESQNKELKNLNESLEEKVAIRTKELSQSNTRLEKLTLTDPLTNLANRRHAMQSMPDYWKISIEQGQPLTCFMIDVDYFKEINDDFGHDTGDLVLTELAETVNDVLRHNDFLCRLGGDEFFLVCPNTNESEGFDIAYRVLNSVRKLKVKNHIEEWACSVSIGGASRNIEMSHYEDLIKAADDALYLAKNAGKNCVKFKK